MTWLALALVAAGLVAPFTGFLDAVGGPWIEGLRTCPGEVVAGWVSDALRPLGLAALVSVLGLRLLPAPRARLGPSSGVLAALVAGSLLVEALKLIMERPRPGAEFLGVVGNSFPSGHVANGLLVAVAILCLWRTRESPPPWAGLLVVGSLVAVVALARVHAGRHWPSDVVGTALLFGGYALLAFRHPSPQARGATVATVLATSAILFGVRATGGTVQLPSPSPGLAVVHHVAIGGALAAGQLAGEWSYDGPDPRRRSAWLRGARGTLALAPDGSPPSTLRIVSRPHPAGQSARCRWLRVAADGRALGERLLGFGWRAYVFRLPEGGWPRSITLEVHNGRPDERRPGAPRAAFSELTLH